MNYGVEKVFYELDAQNNKIFDLDNEGRRIYRTHKVIVPVASFADGSTGAKVLIGTVQDRKIIDANPNGNTYYGTAPFGSAKFDAVWTIERRDANNDWQSSQVNQVWNNRVAATYNNGVA